MNHGSSSRTRKLPVLVLLPYEPLHGRVHLVDVHRDWWFCILRVEVPIRDGIAIALHILRARLDALFFNWPSKKPTSTCSLDQISMLNDFTFDTCVPSFRWRAAHRMHKNIPSYPHAVLSAPHRFGSNPELRIKPIECRCRCVEEAGPSMNFKTPRAVAV